MVVNGKETALNGKKTLAAFLEESGYTISRVAVELDGEIVPKAQYGSVFLSEESKIEIVSFVGGG